MFPIRWNEIFRKKDGTLGTMEDLGGGGGGGYTLPTATASRLGGVKIGNGINVSEDGTISVSGGGGTATKVYYKDFNSPDAVNIPLATFADGAASASGFNICNFGNSVSVNVSGYTPISAIAIDVYTGYAFNVSIKKMGNNWYLSLGLASREIDSRALKIRVLYVADTNYEQMPT